MRTMIAVSVFGLLALGTDAVSLRTIAKTPLDLDAGQAVQTDVQAPRVLSRLDDEIQAPRTLPRREDESRAPRLEGGDIQAPLDGGGIHAPLGREGRAIA